MVMGQLDAPCCRVHIVLCFSFLTTKAVRHRMLILRHEIPDFSAAKDDKRRASCDSICEKRIYWGK